MKTVLLFNLIIFLILIIVAIFLEHFTDIDFNKKGKIIVCIVFLLGISISNYFFTVSMNPIISPKFQDNALILNKKISLKNIESIKYFSNCSLKITPNGFRQNYKNYYSGEANVSIINVKNKEIASYYKAKVYYHLDGKNLIMIKEKTTNKTYIFNLKTKKETKNLYQKLLKSVQGK